MYTSQDFEATFKDSVTDFDLKQWEFLFQTDTSFKVYRRIIKQKPEHMKHLAELELTEYRAVGVIPSIEPHLAFKVYMDTEYRRKFDAHQGTTVVHDHPETDDHRRKSASVSRQEILNSQKLEWAVKYPWPLADRVYLFDRQSRLIANHTELVETSTSQGPASYVVKCKSNYGNHINAPETCTLPAAYKNHVVVENYHQDWVFTDLSRDNLKQIFEKVPITAGTAVIMTYFEHGGSNLPKTIVQWALQSGIPSFIASLLKACAERAKEQALKQPNDQTTNAAESAKSAAEKQPEAISHTATI